MSNPDIDQLFKEGVAAIRAGDKAAGREKLMKAIEQNQIHEQAWLWLSAVVETDEERITCLQNVLTINPKSDAARKGLQKLGALLPDEVPSKAAEPPLQPVEPQPTMPSDKPDGLGGFTDEESWRAKLYQERPASEPETLRDTPRKTRVYSDATLIPTEEEIILTLNDLAGAWLNAIILKIVGPYDHEVRYGPVTHIVTNIVVAVLLQVVSAVAAWGAFLYAGGGQDLIESFNEMGATLNQVDAAGIIPAPFRPAVDYFLSAGGGGFTFPAISPDVAASFGIILVAYLLVTLMATFFWQLFRGFVINAVSAWLGGKGAVIQTTLALTIGLVAYNIIALPFSFVLGGAVFLQAVPPGTIFVVQTGLSIYQFLQSAVAVNASHKLGILASMGAIIIGGVVMNMTVSCLFGILIFLLGGIGA